MLRPSKTSLIQAFWLLWQASIGLFRLERARDIDVNLGREVDARRRVIEKVGWDLLEMGGLP